MKIQGHIILDICCRTGRPSTAALLLLSRL